MWERKGGWGIILMEAGWRGGRMGTCRGETGKGEDNI